MSADNGIYILRLRDDKCRVIHAQAIDNLWWDFTARSRVKDLVPTRVVHYFGQCEELSYPEALIKAHEMEEEIMNSDFPILEYGVSVIRCNLTWDELIKAAKEHAKKEIEAIAHFNDGRWDYDVNILTKMLEKH